jgi:hypothetical protein
MGLVPTETVATTRLVESAKALEDFDAQKEGPIQKSRGDLRLDRDLLTPDRVAGPQNGILSAPEVAGLSGVSAPGGMRRGPLNPSSLA